MAERPSLAVSDVDGIITVEDHRVHVGGQYLSEAPASPRAGYLPGIPSPLVTASSPTPDGFVHVDPFHRVQTSGRGQGGYQQCLDARKDINVLGTAPADTTNDRHDLIVGQQSDQFYGDVGNDYVVRHIVGTPAATPTDPTVDGSPDWYLIARVVVPANATAIVQGDIQPGPSPLTVTAGGVLPVADQAARDAIVAPYSGVTVWRVDQSWLETYDGTAWRVQGTAKVTLVADLGTLITDPYDGQLAVVGADDQLYQFDVTAWTPYPRNGVVARGRRETIVTAVTTTSEGSAQKIMEISADLVAGRLYEVQFQAPVWSDAEGQVRFQLNYTTDGSIPGPGSVNRLRQTSRETPAAGRFVNILFGDFYAPATTQTFRVVSSYFASIAGTYHCAGQSDWPIVMTVEDVGPDPGDAGTEF